MAKLVIDRIVDTTLREGEQTPTVYFRSEEKCRIAEMLRYTLGKKGYIEIGQPYSPKYRDGVEAVIQHFRQKGFGNDRTLVHCRALREDVDIAKAVQGWGVVVVLAPSEKHLLHKLNGLSYKKALERISDVVAYAKNEAKFTNVQYTLEDATSVPLENLIDVAKTAENAGADIVRIPDTKGQADFESFRHIISHLREAVKVPLDVHCHNDRGLATANAIAALQGGATGIHVSIMGLGERNGITDLATLAENLETLYGVKTGVDFARIPELYNYVAAAAGVSIPPNTPITGYFSRVHKAGEHQKSVIRCPDTYETINWDKFGIKREYEFGAMQSKELIEATLKGLEADPEAKKRIIERIRTISSAKGRSLRRTEVWRIIEEESGVHPIEALAAGDEPIDAIIFIKVRPSCDELDLIKSIRKRFLENTIPIRIRDMAGDWDFIIDAKGIRDPETLDRITAEIRRHNKDIMETSTSIVFDEYK